VSRDHDPQQELSGIGNLTVAELVALAIELDIPAADLVADATEAARSAIDRSRAERDDPAPAPRSPGTAR
jgi:hypothetical protein